LSYSVYVYEFDVDEGLIHTPIKIHLDQNLPELDDGNKEE
jgi:hypothetical protein